MGALDARRVCRVCASDALPDVVRDERGDAGGGDAQECLRPHLLSKESLKAYGERGLQGALSGTFVEVRALFAPLVSMPVFFRLKTTELC